MEGKSTKGKSTGQNPLQLSVSASGCQLGRLNINLWQAVFYSVSHPLKMYTLPNSIPQCYLKLLWWRKSWQTEKNHTLPYYLTHWSNPEDRKERFQAENERVPIHLQTRTNVSPTNHLSSFGILMHRIVFSVTDVKICFYRHSKLTKYVRMERDKSLK